MKILFINNGSGIRKGLSGGTERLLQLCKYLHDKGDDIHIITARGDTDFFDELGLGAHYTVNPNPLASFPDNKLTRSLWYAIAVFTTLLHYPKARKADIIYSPSDYVCDVIPAVILSLLTRRPLAAFIHHECRPPKQRKGSRIVNTLSYYTQRLSFALIRKCAHLLFVYDTAEGRVIACYFPNNTVVLAQNGIDPVFCQQGSKAQPKYALFAGGLRPSKGAGELLDVWAHVVAQKPTAILKMAGGGDAAYTETIKQKISALNLNNNIVLMGALNKQTLLEEYHKAGFYAACSHEEGWGISVYQALASQLEVFIFDLPCYGRISPFCHIYTPADIKAMADDIVKALDDELPLKAPAFPASEYFWSNVLASDRESLRKISNAN